MADVVLVHGLWYRSWSLASLKHRLRQNGHDVHTFSYPTLANPVEQNAVHLADYCLKNCSGTTHLVGHSLGGLVIVSMLQHEEEPNIGRVVFLGTPLNGSLVARRLGASRLTKWMLGRAVPALSVGCHLTENGPDCGMISGTLPTGLGRLTGSFGEPNDGTVAVAETASDQLADRIELNTSHTGLLFSREAAHQAAKFLEQGRFEHA